jgi:hypothetical protein
MRYILSLAVLGLAVGAGAPAFAQQQQGQQPSYVYQGQQQQNNNPVFNNLGTYRENINNNPYYNSGANLQMLPMQQMVAGKNGPSYAFGNRQEQQQNSLYGDGGFGGGVGGISPQQANALRAQRNANAAAYQQQYFNSVNQREAQQYAQQQQGMTGSQYQGAQFNQLYTDNQQPKPVKKKVIYNELNNPLKEPPRLFNPDR